MVLLIQMSTHFKQLTFTQKKTIRIQLLLGMYYKRCTKERKWLPSYITQWNSIFVIFYEQLVVIFIDSLR